MKYIKVKIRERFKFQTLYHIGIEVLSCSAFSEKICCEIQHVHWKLSVKLICLYIIIVYT